MSEQVQIAAAGCGSRLRPYMDELGYEPNYPKHLLPTGGAAGETFLGRIVQQILPVTTADRITMHVNMDNLQMIGNHYDIPGAVNYDTTPYNHSLDMFFERLLETKQRVIGCAGDYYAEDDISALLSHHEKSGLPVTALAGYSVSADCGVTYGLSGNKVTSIRRLDRTASSEPLNIGAYVFEPDNFVMRVIRTHRRNTAEAPTDDRIFEAFVRQGLLGAFVTEKPTFNVNTPETYNAMWTYSQSAQQRSASA